MYDAREFKKRKERKNEKPLAGENIGERKIKSEKIINVRPAP